VLQQKLGLQLCTPPDDLLLSINPDYLKRRIAKPLLGDASGLHYPAFIKSVVPKLFTSRVYESYEAILAQCNGLDISTEIIVSEVVHFTKEARAFVLEETVLDCAIYEGSGEADDARTFIQKLTHFVHLPRAVVVDAGLNGCRPELIWPCIAAASKTRANE
jgi:hypothetical protein